MRALNNTPPWLVKNGQVVDFGHFKEPFANLNIDEAEIWSPKVFPPKIIRMARLKEWQHFAIINSEIFLGFMLFTTHYLSSSFCYCVDRKSGEFFEHHSELPGPTAKISRELWNSASLFQKSGYEVRVQNRLDEGLHKAHIDIRDSDKPGVGANIEMIEKLDSLQPLISVLPIAPNRPLYTHKCACPVRGTVSVGDRAVELDEDKDIAVIDIQKAYYPYDTFWRWATCAGYSGKKGIVAINLVKNFIADDERWNENVLWVGGKMSELSAAKFEYDENNVLKPWRVATTDGRCDLTFTPQGERHGKVDYGLIKSDFHQPYGLYNGSVTDDDGKKHKIKNFFGVCEHHLARF